MEEKTQQKKTVGVVLYGREEKNIYSFIYWNPDPSKIGKK